MNNPMIPHEQKRIYHERKGVQPPKLDQNQILNLQLYQPKRPRPSQRDNFPHPAVFYPNYVPNPFDPVSYANYMQQHGYGMGQVPPVYNEYNINVGGIEGSHVKTAMLYEDVLPVKDIAGSYSSLGERITMYESVRSILFSSGDGNDVPIENNTYNLLSHLKLMDMNPYNASRYSKNPYNGLPMGFLLYRSCYPIRHDERNARAICSSKSMGINVRIYKLTEGSYMINRNDIAKLSDYDEWRDMAFYNFVKEHIIKKKICPNFTIMYGYNITLNANIKFDDLQLVKNMIKGTGVRITDRPLFADGYGDGVQMQKGVHAQSSNIAPNTGKHVSSDNTHGMRTVTMNVKDVRTGANIQKHIRVPVKGIVMANVRDPVTGTVSRHIIREPTEEQQKKELDRYLGKVLVCLTEASNYNLLGWAKKEYRRDGNISRMINTGFHTEKVWMSVIFQLMSAIYTMQVYGMIINDFKIDRHVFIKDISMGGNVTKYWKYVIDGIEYYIPNYGYLVLIDTNFRDFDKECVGRENDPTRMRKLDGAFLDQCKLDVNICIDLSFEMFRQAIDPNIYDQDFVNDNGIKPPESVIRLLSNMRKEADVKATKVISYYIRKFMTMFMNNRTGTPLTEIERNKVKRGGIKEFRKGQIVATIDKDGIEKFVIFVKKKETIALIITKDDIDPKKSNIIEKEVPISSLDGYSVLDPIVQNFKATESNLSEEALLETYTIN